MHIFYRLGHLFSRIVAATANVGLLNAIKLYCWQAWRTSKAKLYAKGLSAPVYFRGARDYHVLTLLFEKNLSFDSNGRAIKTAIDLGANIGIETLRMVALYPDINIVAVEADKNNFQILQENVRQYPNVIARNAAAWGEPARFRVKADPNCNMASTVQLDNEGDIEGLTVNQIIDSLNVEEVDVLKIDVEGAESSIFSSQIESWIRRVKVIIWELNDHEAPGALLKLTAAMRDGRVSFNFHISGERLVAIRSDVKVALIHLVGLRRTIR
jgi:FkbM family methyltransferase